MIRFDNFKSVSKLFNKEILLELHKTQMIEDQYALDDYLQELLDVIKKYFNVQFAIVLNPRTPAIQTVLNALDCGYSDEIILSTYGPQELAGTIKTIGANPIFVDVNDDLSINQGQVLSNITKKTKAIISTDIHCAKLSHENFQKESNLLPVQLIRYIPDPIFMDANSFRFKKSEIVCMNFMTSNFWGVGGEASLVLLSNEKIYNSMRNRMNCLMVSDSAFRTAVPPVALDVLSAAVFKVKFHHLNELKEIASRIGGYYKQNLPSSVYWGRDYIYVKNARRLVEFMERKDIEMRKGYSCLHLNSLFSSRFQRADLAKAQSIAPEILKLPMRMDLNEDNMKYICENITYFMRYRPVYDFHKRRKYGKLTLFQNDEVVSVFNKRDTYLNAKKGYRYFSKIAHVPKTVFQEKQNKMVMISEYIRDAKGDMNFDDVLLRMGKLLTKLHKKGRHKISRTVYDFLIARNYSPRHEEIISLLKEYKVHFSDKFIHHIHGDYSDNNLLFTSRKIYLVDLDGYCIFDCYSDLASVYLNTCRRDSKLFDVFLKSYSRDKSFHFSRERFYINVLMKLLPLFYSRLEDKRYSAKIIFDEYLDKLKTLNHR